MHDKIPSALDCILMKIIIIEIYYFIHSC